jgi:hypothetical protein
MTTELERDSLALTALHTVYAFEMSGDILAAGECRIESRLGGIMAQTPQAKI